MIDFKTNRRTVAKQDEIPVKYLTDKAVQKRCRKKSYEMSEKAKIKIVSCYSELLLSVNHETVQSMLEAIDDGLKSSGLLRNSVCAKGCAMCCDIPVDVTLAEAQNISYRTGVKINRNSNRDINGPCPFSKGNVCSIYEYRPLSCRCFLALDHPKHCFNNDAHNYHSFKSHDMFLCILNEFSRAQVISERVMDIRHFFSEDELFVFA